MLHLLLAGSAAGFVRLATARHLLSATPRERIACEDVRSPAPPPSRSDRPVAEAYETLFTSAGEFWKVPLGVGHLRPGGDLPYWPDDRSWGLPLFASPDGPQAGWIYNGWLTDGNGRTPLGSRGMIETSYESASFVVLQAREDGWLRFRFRREQDGPGDGTAWVHRCHLGLTETGLRFEPWHDRFLSSEISPLYFRAPVAHALRSGPGRGAPLLTWIAGDHHLEPLEIQGDWMKVTLKRPSDYCAGPDEPPVTGQTGWVQWRSAAIGPWVWYYTRGC